MRWIVISFLFLSSFQILAAGSYRFGDYSYLLNDIMNGKAAPADLDKVTGVVGLLPADLTCTPVDENKSLAFAAKFSTQFAGRTLNVVTKPKDAGDDDDDGDRYGKDVGKPLRNFLPSQFRVQLSDANNPTVKSAINFDQWPKENVLTLNEKFTVEQFYSKDDSRKANRDPEIKRDGVGVALARPFLPPFTGQDATPAVSQVHRALERGNTEDQSENRERFLMCKTVQDLMAIGNSSGEHGPNGPVSKNPLDILLLMKSKAKPEDVMDICRLKSQIRTLSDDQKKRQDDLRAQVVGRYGDKLGEENVQRFFDSTDCEHPKRVATQSGNGQDYLEICQLKSQIQSQSGDFDKEKQKIKAHIKSQYDPAWGIDNAQRFFDSTACEQLTGVANRPVEMADFGMPTSDNGVSKGVKLHMGNCEKDFLKKMGLSDAQKTPRQEYEAGIRTKAVGMNSVLKGADVADACCNLKSCRDKVGNRDQAVPPPGARPGAADAAAKP